MYLCGDMKPYHKGRINNIIITTITSSIMISNSSSDKSWKFRNHIPSTIDTMWAIET
jgi:hypothetical protein